MSSQLIMKKILKQLSLIILSLIIAYASSGYEIFYKVGDIYAPQGGFPFIFLKDSCYSSVVGVLGIEDDFYLNPFLGNVLFYFLLLNLLIFLYIWLRKKRSSIITEAVIEDIASIIEIQKTGWLATYISEEHGITADDILAKDFTSPERMARWGKFIVKQKALVAKDNNKVIAFISLEKSDKESKLGAVYVLPEYQGRGIGKRLIQQGLEWLGSDKDIILDVVTYNDKAIAIYQKLGFEKMGEPPAEDLAKLPSGKTMPEVRMVLRRSGRSE